tara:strand:+ start:34109 stop:34342 length:234 start_codon:yes stop_codon:yes gene_type:complete
VSKYTNSLEDKVYELEQEIEKARAVNKELVEVLRFYALDELGLAFGVYQEDYGKTAREYLEKHKEYLTKSNQEQEKP